MDVLSVCPLQVGSLYWQPREQAHAVTVVAKATFELVQGQARLADVQDYPHDADNHWNDDANRSLYAASDLAPFKPKADVVLVGEAFSPGGQPARSLVARLMVGNIDKTIEVVRDRHFTQAGELVEGKRFTRMALRWERAAGGPHSNNPVGLDRDGERDRYGRLPVPNLQAAGIAVNDVTDAIDPVGFGPIAATWPMRRSLLGRHAQSWSDHSWTHAPLPQDIDGSFFNSAPVDQRLDELRDSECITLENLHPSEPRLVCHLPGVRPRVFVERQGAVRELLLRADTLWIDTTRLMCTVTWRGRVDLERPNDQGRVVVALEQPGQHLTWADVRKRIGDKPHDVADEATADGVDDEFTAVGVFPPQRKEALPFVPGAIGSKPPPPAAGGRRARSFDGMTGAIPIAQHPSDRSPAWMQGQKGAGPATGPGAGSRRSSSLPPSSAAAQAQTDLNATLGSGVSPWAKGDAATDKKVAGELAVRHAVAMPAQPARSAPPPISAAPAPALAPPMRATPPPAPSAPAVRPPNPVEALREANKSAPPPARADAEPKPRARARLTNEIVELIWYDEASVPKIREEKSWARVLEELARENEKAEDPLDFDEEPPPEEPAEVVNRRTVVGIMTRGHQTSAVGIQQSMLEAVDESGHFDPPLVLMSGKLLFPFDQLETLKATLAAVTPLIAGNQELQSTVDAVQELMSTPWLQQGSGDVAEGLTEKVRKAFKSADRVIDPNYLDDHTERTLLERRCYQKRTLFGEEWIRALMAPTAGKTKIPTYIPEKLGKELPMFKEFTAKVIAEAHVQQDQYESSESSLKVVAFGRVVTFRGGAHMF